MSLKYSRREMLSRTGQALLAGAVALPACFAETKSGAGRKRGAVIGEEAGARAGEMVLAEGGNAIDAAVAAALTSCAATPARCGIAGYGGHMTIALAGGKKIVSIDFNTAAPSAAREDMFALDAAGEVKGRVNMFGWLAAGVPGTLAGLQLALDHYGTRSFRELVQPAIAVAKNGFVINNTFVTTVRGAASRFRNDPGSAKLYLRDGAPRTVGENLANPDLAELLSTLAERNSVDSFYRGDVALRVAEAFRKNEGLVTAKDLAAYQAVEVEPLRLKWNHFEICTAPLTAGGLTMLEAFSILKALDWASMAGSPKGAHAQLEALRLAWKDRLDQLGDPEKVSVPVERLLSTEYAAKQSARIKAALREKKPVSIEVQKHTDEGTNNISSVDEHGNMVAITLTQGGSFGAQVTIDGLGLTLGHGMSRFDPHPGRPNSPAPGKRPLHNMCPSVVLRRGRPVLAIGGAGGVRIPNAMYDSLRAYVARGQSMEEAIATPRLHSTGTLEVSVESSWPAKDGDYLKQVGFKLTTAQSTARISAISFDPKTGECRVAMR